jgi:hypothetical protein
MIPELKEKIKTSQNDIFWVLCVALSLIFVVGLALLIHARQAKRVQNTTPQDARPQTALRPIVVLYFMPKKTRGRQDTRFHPPANNILRADFFLF